MNSHHRWPWLIVLVITLGLGLAGCKQDGVGTRNVVQVVTVNENVPLLSDVYHFGDNPDDPADDFIPVDMVEVTFASRVHDPALTIYPGQPFSSVVFHTYSVVFDNGTNADGADLNQDGQTDLYNFTAPMSAYVPIGSVGQAAILIIDGGTKVEAPIGCLGPLASQIGGCSGNVDNEYKVDALLTFYGTEETSGSDLEVQRGLTIRIAQFGDD
jgi:hypothetical protein